MHFAGPGEMEARSPKFVGIKISNINVEPVYLLYQHLGWEPLPPRCDQKSRSPVISANQNLLTLKGTWEPLAENYRTQNSKPHIFSKSSLHSLKTSPKCLPNSFLSNQLTLKKMKNRII